MRIDLDPRAGLKRSAGSVLIEQGRNGEAIVSGPRGALSATVLDSLSVDQEIACWATDRCVVAIGLNSHQIATFDLVTWTVRVEKGLERLDLPGYDPGGLHRVDFFPVQAGLLVETEVGLLLVAASGIIWSYVHDDLTRRVIEIEADRVILEGEHGRTVLSLRGGREILA